MVAISIVKSILKVNALQTYIDFRPSTSVQNIKKLILQITLDDEDIRNLNVGWLRRQVAVVSQEPVLYSWSIADNIRCGRQNITQEDIEQAAKEANAHDFIKKLPKVKDAIMF